MESTRKRSPLSPPQSPHLSSNSSSPTSRRQPTRVIAESSNYDKLATINDLALSEFSSGSSALGVGRRYDTVGGAGEDDYEPGGDSANATIVEARRREKGKGRMRVVPEGEEVEPTSSSTRERSNGSESPAYDEAEQERRVTENLAQWSQAEKKRRQTIRRSEALVLPSPPITTASLVSLGRRSSALVRTASKRTQTAGVESQGRRAARRKSIKLPERNPELEDTTEVPEESLDARRERESSVSSSTLDDASASSSLCGSTANNPLSSSASSRPIEPAHSTSRFIEHLPHQSATSPPSTSYAAILTSIGDDEPPSSPSTPHHLETDRILFQSPPTNSRPFPIKRGSGQSLASIDTVIPARYGTSMESARALVSPSTENMDFDKTSRPKKRWNIFARRVDEGEDEEDFDEEDEVDDRGGVGVLDWLLCGCFRSSIQADDAEDCQAARTNPME